MRVSNQIKTMSPGMKFLYFRITPLIFMLTGGVFLFFGLRQLVRAKSSVDWPNTQGEIVASSVIRRDSIYRAVIRYEFTVDGTTFNGSRVAYGDFSSNNSSHARRIVNNYPKGKRVTVYYMPDNPEECLLEPGVKGQSWFLFGFGLVFFALGCVMAIFLPNAIRKQEITEQGTEGDAANRATWLSR